MHNRHIVAQVSLCSDVRRIPQPCIKVLAQQRKIKAPIATTFVKISLFSCTFGEHNMGDEGLQSCQREPYNAKRTPQWNQRRLTTPNIPVYSSPCTSKVMHHTWNQGCGRGIFTVSSMLMALPLRRSLKILNAASSRNAIVPADQLHQSTSLCAYVSPQQRHSMLLF